MVTPDLALGDGVCIPWGLDTARGEVVDLIPPDRVLVRVPLEDAAGNVIDETTIPLGKEVVTPLPRWRVVKSRAGLPAPGADAAKSWWIDAQRDNQHASVEVRLSGSLAASTRSPAESSEAVRTSGRSAIAKFARRFRLPRVIVVGTAGVVELADPVADEIRAAAVRHERAELAVADWLASDGWAIEHTQPGGFPYDFIARRGSETMYGEVKALPGRLTQELLDQVLVLVGLMPSVAVGAVRYALFVAEASVDRPVLDRAKERIEVYRVTEDRQVERLA